jgi:hypothetical protein
MNPGLVGVGWFTGLGLGERGAGEGCHAVPWQLVLQAIKDLGKVSTFWVSRVINIGGRVPRIFEESQTGTKIISVVQSNRLIKLLPYISYKLFILQPLRQIMFLRKYGVRHHRNYFTADTQARNSHFGGTFGGRHHRYYRESGLWRLVSQSPAKPDLRRKFLQSVHFLPHYEHFVSLMSTFCHIKSRRLKRIPGKSPELPSN